MNIINGYNNEPEMPRLANTQINLEETAKKYTSKITSILNLCSDLANLSDPALTEKREKMEKELLSFEKIINEETIMHIIASLRINCSCLSKLKEIGYDFDSLPKQVIPHEKVVIEIEEMLKKI